MTFVKFNQPARGQRFPFNPIYSDLLSNLSDSHPAGEISTGGIPPVNISETPMHYQIDLAAPGNKKEDFVLSIEDGKLTVSIAKKEEATERAAEILNYTRREIVQSIFSRSFNLPEEADQDVINATYDAGILTITIGKREDVKLRKIARNIVIK